jgi:hypothetical protein
MSDKSENLAHQQVPLLQLLECDSTLKKKGVPYTPEINFKGAYTRGRYPNHERTQSMRDLKDQKISSCYCLATIISLSTHLCRSYAYIVFLEVEVKPCGPKRYSCVGPLRGAIAMGMPLEVHGLR